MNIHPLETSVRKFGRSEGESCTENALRRWGMPLSYQSVFDVMDEKQLWRTQYPEKMFSLIARVEALPGLITLVDQALSRPFCRSVQQGKAVNQWLRTIIKDALGELSDSQFRTWIGYALQAGSPEALETLGVQPKSLKPEGLYLSAMLASRKSEMAAYFEPATQWPVDFHHEIVVDIATFIADNPGVKEEPLMLQAFLHKEVPGDLFTSKMLGSKPVCRALIAHEIRPNIDAVAGLTAANRMLFYRAKLIGKDDARITSAMLRRRIDNDFEM